MLSGSVGDYDAAAQTAIKTVLATESDVSTSAVSLTLTAGSVLVAADIFFGTEAGASTAAARLSTGVLADATSLEAAVNAQFGRHGARPLHHGPNASRRRTGDCSRTPTVIPTATPTATPTVTPAA